MAIALIPGKLSPGATVTDTNTLVPAYGPIAAVALLVGAVFLGGVYLYELRGPAMPLTFEAPTGTTVAHAASVAVTSTSAAPIREMHIANNGLVLLRGGVITQITDRTIRLSIEWGGIDFQWDVLTDMNTSFFSKDGNKQTLAALHPGEYLSSVTGQLVAGAAGPTIDAAFVRS